MVEIRKFYITESGEECYHKPFLFDCLNGPKIALLFFLEREYGEYLTIPDYLESPLLNQIEESETGCRYFLTELEGFIAIKID